MIELYAVIAILAAVIFFVVLRRFDVRKAIAEMMALLPFVLLVSLAWMRSVSVQASILFCVVCVIGISLRIIFEIRSNGFFQAKSNDDLIQNTEQTKSESEAGSKNEKPTQ